MRSDYTKRNWHRKGILRIFRIIGSILLSYSNRSETHPFLPHFSVQTNIVKYSPMLQDRKKWREQRSILMLSLNQSISEWTESYCWTSHYSKSLQICIHFVMFMFTFHRFGSLLFFLHFTLLYGCVDVFCFRLFSLSQSRLFLLSFKN